MPLFIFVNCVLLFHIEYKTRPLSLISCPITKELINKCPSTNCSAAFCGEAPEESELRYGI